MHAHAHALFRQAATWVMHGENPAMPLGCMHTTGTVKDGHGNTGDGVDTHASRKRS